MMKDERAGSENFGFRGRDLPGSVGPGRVCEGERVKNFGFRICDLGLIGRPGDEEKIKVTRSPNWSRSTRRNTRRLQVVGRVN